MIAPRDARGKTAGGMRAVLIVLIVLIVFIL
jgi:hypothetical protein